MRFLNLLKTVALTLVALITACSTVTIDHPAASAPGPDYALVYFYRNENSPVGAVGVDLKDNGVDIGTLQNGTYFVYHANPGQHVFTMTTDATSTQQLTLEGGATYYVKTSVAPVQHAGKPSLEVAFDLQGQAAIQNLKRVDYHE